nr:biotin--[acetyl-CoA-carboxylase] ligase [uncultured Holophaga sp.]
MKLPLIILPEVDSTQAFLQRHPELGFCAVLATSQTAGRGRGEHAWESPAGAGLWLSAALPLPQLAPGIVLQRAMGAVAELLQTPEVPLGLKWPNDLVARRGSGLVKVGGILGELQENRMILGLGINLSAAPSIPGRPIPPACLRDLGLEPPSAPELARGILQAWSRWDREPHPAFRWPAPGEAVAWEGDQGRCLGWLDDGRLELQTPGGPRQLSAGDLRSLTQLA